MKTYNVVFRYSVEVEANSTEEAYEIAVSELQDNMNNGYLDNVSDMAYQVEEVKK